MSKADVQINTHTIRTSQESYCHAEPTEHRHDFVQGPARDETRQTWFDPMICVEIYVDTGDPVYNFPYRPSAGKACRFCGRPEKTLDHIGPIH